VTDAELQAKLDELRRLPAETEWVEFKHNNENPQDLGEYLSALSNGAALHGRRTGYLFGESRTARTPFWALRSGRSWPRRATKIWKAGSSTN
jgi:hypothetical protein